MALVIVENDHDFAVFNEGKAGPDGDPLASFDTRTEAERYIADQRDEKQPADLGREYKAAATYIQDIGDRTVTGFSSVMGNVDSGADIVHPGAFKKSITENLRRIRYLWQHRTDQPPIAVIKSISEVGRDQLPADLLAEYPDANGALLVSREYLKNDRAQEVFENIKAGSINELSFGFEVVKKDFSKIAGQMVRHLREIRLFECSDVLWGMNPATRAAKSAEIALDWAALFLDQISHSKADLESALFDVKAGRMISTRNLERLKQALAAITEIVTAAEPPNDDHEPEMTPDHVMALTDQHMLRVRLNDYLSQVANWGSSGNEYTTTGNSTAN